MEQVKQFLEQLKKYHFWLLAALAVVISLIGWYSAKNALSADYKVGKDKVNGYFEKVKRVANTPEHPNEKWTEAITSVTEKQKSEVSSSWYKVYNTQRDTALQWPKALGTQFHGIMAKVGPYDPIPERACEIYQSYINKEFKELLKIVSARSFDEKIVPTDEENPKVVWAKDNQRRIFDQLSWPKEPPTSPQVRSVQENLWVYEALLKIIKEINGQSGDVSKISKIEDLSIGREAGDEFGRVAGARVWHTSAVAAAQANNHIPAPAPPPQANSGSLNKGAAEAAKIGLAEEGRYVDDQGRSLPAGGKSVVEFKRMPVHMKLVMDQRAIAKLLVECANSPLPVDVRQLRINTGASTRVVANAGRRILKLTNDDNKNPHEVVVEIHGIIYIFNPPNPSMVGQQPADAEAPAAGDAAQAAAPPPANAPPAAPPPQ